MIEGLVVAIDSSRRRGGSVALAENGVLLAESLHDPARGYAESFFGLLEDVLRHAGRTREEIAALAVVAGPGSFTGLRIGVMTAKSLSFALDLPLYAAGSLELLASRALPRERGAILALMDAGRDAVYAAAFEAGDEGLVPLDAARRIALGPELWGLLAGLPSPLELVPDGEEIVALLDRNEDLESHEWTILDPAPLGGILACELSEEKPWCRRVGAAELMPIYLGPSQAERVHGLDLGKETHRPRPPQRDGGI